MPQAFSFYPAKKPIQNQGSNSHQYHSELSQPHDDFQPQADTHSIQIRPLALNDSSYNYPAMLQNKIFQPPFAVPWFAATPNPARYS